MKPMKPQHKKLSALLALSLWAARPLSAQILPPGMEDLATSILDIFTGPFVRIILAIFLCGSAIAYGFNKDNEKIKRNCIAVGVSAAIIIAASAIVDAVWTASGG